MESVKYIRRGSSRETEAFCGNNECYKVEEKRYKREKFSFIKTGFSSLKLLKPDGENIQENNDQNTIQALCRKVVRENSVCMELCIVSIDKIRYNSAGSPIRSSIHHGSSPKEIYYKF